MSRPTPSRYIPRLIRSLAFASAAFTLVLQTGTVAGAVPAPWSVTPLSFTTAGPSVGNSLQTVSCVTSTECTAVGSNDGGVLEVDTLSGGVWTMTSPFPSLGTDYSWNAISCSDATDCVAVANYIGANATGYPAILQETAGTWNKLAVTWPSAAANGSVTDVSCAGGVCEISGSGNTSLAKSPALVVTVTGSSATVTLPTLPAGVVDQSFNSVSCVSSTWCLFGGSQDTTNGTSQAISTVDAASTFTTSVLSTPATYTAFMLDDVSCSDVSVCAALGDASTSKTDVIVGSRWNGTSWSSAVVSVPKSLTGLSAESLSCFSATSCVGLTGSPLSSTAGVEVALAGTTWSVSTLSGPAGGQNPELLGGACLAANSCEFVGDAEVSSNLVPIMDFGNGSTWVVTTGSSTPGTPKGEFSGGACFASTCVAFGSAQVGTSLKSSETGVVGSTTGGGWTLSSIAPPSGVTLEIPTTAACASATRCFVLLAVVTSSKVYMVADSFNGSTWTTQSLPAPAGAAGSEDLSLSCPSAASCFSIGGWTNKLSGNSVTPYKLSWNGSSWSQSSVAIPAAAVNTAPESLSCPTTGFCLGVGQSSKNTSAVIYQYTAGKWNILTNTFAFTDAAANASVACENATHCLIANVSVSKKPVIGIYNAGKITTASLAAPAGTTWRNLSAVSCSSASCTVLGVTTKDAVYAESVSITGAVTGSVALAVPSTQTSINVGGLSCTTLHCTAFGQATADGTAGDPATVPLVATSA